MEVGQVKVAEDKDFEHLKWLVDNNTGWKLDYSKGTIKVWTKNVSNTNFKMVKVKAEFVDIEPELLYDVLHDPEYRKVWDPHMIEAKDIGCINPNNDVGYYSMSCPTPLGNRDFVLQRSWLDLGSEKYILNHSVYHCQHPPRQGFIRATSYLTGYLVRCFPNMAGCELGYISQTDPQGTLPPWLVNRVTQICGPKLIKDLQKASLGYNSWKASHNPQWKPWIFPEQILSPRIKLTECVKSAMELELKSEADAKLEAALVKHKRGKLKPLPEPELKPEVDAKLEAVLVKQKKGKPKLPSELEQKAEANVKAEDTLVKQKKGKVKPSDEVESKSEVNTKVESSFFKFKKGKLKKENK